MSRRIVPIARTLAALLLAAALAMPSGARADFDSGFAAYLGGDYAGALAEWRPLAEGGDPQAQFGLGLLYEQGDGVPPDLEQAARWYERAAEGGHTLAQAAQWYARAAGQGNAQAQFNLGVAYEHGQGVPMDLGTAAYWYSQAANQGYVRAAERVYALTEAGLMVPAESPAGEPQPDPGSPAAPEPEPASAAEPVAAAPELQAALPSPEPASAALDAPQLLPVPEAKPEFAAPEPPAPEVAALQPAPPDPIPVEPIPVEPVSVPLDAPVPDTPASGPAEKPVYSLEQFLNPEPAPLVAPEPAPAPQAAPAAELSPALVLDPPADGFASAPVATPVPPPEPAPARHGPMLWLASFLDPDSAQLAWLRLQADHADLLGPLQPTVMRVEPADGSGVYFRLLAGTAPSLATAQTLCAALIARGLYCQAIDG